MPVIFAMVIIGNNYCDNRIFKIHVTILVIIGNNAKSDFHDCLCF